MDSKATVQALMDSIQKGDFAKAKSLISKDFIFSGPVPEPIGGDTWLAMSRNMKKAFPNLAYHFYLENMLADTASISAHLEGAQTRQWDLRSMNMGVIPATHRAFSADGEAGKVTVKGDKVTTWAFEPTAGAGLKAILGQLGVHSPTI